MTDWSKAPVPVRHARLLNVLTDITNEVNFSGHPEASESVNRLLEEAHQIVRSLQVSSAAGMTMEPE